jgi:hypothetical protein
VAPILEEAQKGLSKFVTSQLSITFLILEGVIYNVNQTVPRGTTQEDDGEE